MDYEKIGKYISKKRKEKGMTQDELALKLNITDRAVSRWERGKGCPDISLLENLANILNVQVLEILHGEDINNDENKIIVNILKIKNKENILWKIISYIFLNLLLIFMVGVLIISHYAGKEIDINKRENISIIKSPSMSPNFNVFDLVFIEKTTLEKINVGDVVVYYSEKSEFDDNVIIHRVVDIDRDNLCLRTKGDANIISDDECVKEKNLVGVVTNRISNIGEVFILFDNVGIVFKIFIILGILAVLFLDFVLAKKYVLNKNQL